MSSSPSISERLQRSAIGPAIRNIVSRSKTRQWKAAGSPPPAPPHVKVATVQSVVRAHRPTAFVETGTYRGDTTAAVAPLVPKVWSIELDARLATLAQARFVDDASITVLQGDSAVRLPEILDQLTGPAVFWLDGHFSGGATAGEGSCPIIEELTSVLGSEFPHVVLVDDARLFDGTDAYPTMVEVTDLVKKLRPTASLDTHDDIVRIVC